MCLQVIGANVMPKSLLNSARPCRRQRGWWVGKKISEGREGGGSQGSGNRHGGVDRCGGL